MFKDHPTAADMKRYTAEEFCSNMDAIDAVRYYFAEQKCVVDRIRHMDHANLRAGLVLFAQAFDLCARGES